MRTALVAVLSVLALASCSILGLSGTSAPDPIPPLVSASRATHDVIAARWRAYVDADQTLSPLMREQLVKLVDDWRLAIERAEAYLAPASPPAPPPEAPTTSSVFDHRGAGVVLQGSSAHVLIESTAFNP